MILGSEDCLYLNVFTPQLPGDNGVGSTYPVIVWIHGGAFCVGSNDSQMYGPDYLLDYGVVLVTINYRYVICFTVVTIRHIGHCIQMFCK